MYKKSINSVNILIITWIISLFSTHTIYGGDQMVINTKDRGKKNNVKECVNLEISNELIKDKQQKENKNCFSCQQDNKK